MSIHDPRFPYRNELENPVIGMEAEFKVFVDGRETTPEEVWKTPAGFVKPPFLRRTSRSLQLPAGGALYFDGGVIEVVTPVIEIAPQCTARVVRSVWEQIAFLRQQLDDWQRRTGRQVRLQAFSCHFNISFELERTERGRHRTIQKLAYLLAHLLPVPVIVAAGNRRSTGVGVRPRRDRIEITFDFTPDPPLMGAAAAMITGIVRDVISWPSYVTTAIPSEIPIVGGVAAGRHPTRSGWVMRDYHYPRNPYETGLDERVWQTSRGVLSLREIAHQTAAAFRDSIAQLSDEGSEKLLFAVLRGDAKSLLDQGDRPSSYDDVRAPRLPWSEDLPRSEYETVFRNLGAGRRLQIGDDLLEPVAVKGWYHAVMRGSDGEERMLSIDQILKSQSAWR